MLYGIQLLLSCLVTLYIVLCSNLFPAFPHHPTTALHYSQMASILAHILCHLLILAINLQVLAIAQAYNVGLGSSLYAINGEDSTWTSPVWVTFRLDSVAFKVKINSFLPDKTIVWPANGNYPADSESKVELTTSGLMLKDPGGWVTLWRTENITNTEVMQGAMLDTGNFVITSRNSDILWESFKDPTNAILPTQVLGVGSNLTSTILENNYKRGKFQLLLLPDGNLSLNQINMFSGNAYKAYYTIAENVIQVVFNSRDMCTPQTTSMGILTSLRQGAWGKTKISTTGQHSISMGLSPCILTQGLLMETTAGLLRRSLPLTSA